jgi:hypothetical protein
MMAVKTTIGWTLLGPSPSGDSGESGFNCCVVEEEVSSDLREEINRMFRHDFLPRPG